MIKKTLFVGAAVLLLVALFAGSGMVSYVTTAVDKVEDSFKSNVPVKFEIERARRMVKDLTPEIEQNMHLIAREEVEIAKLERELSGSEKQLAKSRSEILRLKGDLESGNSQFVYAGRSYSAFEVKTDLANRFQHHKTVEATVRKPVWETVTKEYTVQVPEMKTVEQTYTVMERQPRTRQGVLGGPTDTEPVEGVHPSG